MCVLLAAALAGGLADWFTDISIVQLTLWKALRAELKGNRPLSKRSLTALPVAMWSLQFLLQM